MAAAYDSYDGPLSMVDHRRMQNKMLISSGNSRLPDMMIEKLK